MGVAPVSILHAVTAASLPAHIVFALTPSSQRDSRFRSSRADAF